MTLAIIRHVLPCPICQRPRQWVYGRTMPTCGGTCLEEFKRRNGLAKHAPVVVEPALKGCK